MTVKIINTTPDQSVIKRKVCWKCGVTLEFVPLDIRRGIKRDYTGSADEYNYITCPNCNCEVNV